MVPRAAEQIQWLDFPSGVEDFALRGGHEESGEAVAALSHVGDGLLKLPTSFDVKLAARHQRLHERARGELFLFRGGEHVGEERLVAEAGGAAEGVFDQ